MHDFDNPAYTLIIYMHLITPHLKTINIVIMTKCAKGNASLWTHGGIMHALINTKDI